MANVGRERNHDRIAGLIFVASVHAVLGYALIIGLGFDLAKRVGDRLKVFDLAEEPPPPVTRPTPAPEKPEDQGAPREDANPSPISPLPPNLRLTVPAELLLPQTPGTGAGIADGAGSNGTGTGIGGRGSGAGGGFRYPAQFLKGSITGSDYPNAARRARAEGVVYVRFIVDLEGRARSCAVTRSSGNAALDSATCRLIERRFRYRPARDDQGQAVADVVVGNQIWWFK
jgi:protein TonB